MPQKSLVTSEQSLKVVSLPTHGESYTVVSHGFIIDETRRQLEAHGFEISSEFYNSNINGEVAQGVYHLSHATDPELGLMFAWANSYDKTMRFRCAIGGYVFVCSNGIIAGDMSNYGRKHVGEAKDEVKSHIIQQVASAQNYYDDLVKAKEQMKKVTVSESDLALLMGRLYFTDDILTSSQLIVVKNQFKAPAHDYGTDSDSLWTVYNHITFALKQSHPKTWMEDQKNLHKVVSDLFLKSETEDLVDPNQLSLLDQVEEVIESTEEVTETVNVEDVADLATPEEVELVEEVTETAEAEDTTLNSFSLDAYLGEEEQESVIDELVPEKEEVEEEVEEEVIPEVKTDDTGLIILDEDEVTLTNTNEDEPELQERSEEGINIIEDQELQTAEEEQESAVLESTSEHNTSPCPTAMDLEGNKNVSEGCDESVFSEIEITNDPININVMEDDHQLTSSTEENTKGSSEFDDFLSDVESNDQNSSEEESPFEF